jgi:uncharacterized protein (TIGR02453 family)
VSTTAFSGFKPDALAFFASLGALQQRFDFEGARAFFNANKTAYEREVKKPLAALVETLSARFAARNIPLRGNRRDSLFRINRDVRFSSDKSPYKTHAGAVLTPTGSKKEQGVLYIHIDPTGCLMAAGFYRPEPAQLAQLRNHVRRAFQRFAGIVGDLESHGLPLSTGDTLKRLPRGFEDVADPAMSQAIKLKGYTVMRPLADADAMDASLADKLEEFAMQTLPLLHFGWEALARSE